MNDKSVAFIIHTLSDGGAERIMSYLTQHYSTAENKYLIVYHRSEIEYDFDGEMICLDIEPSNNAIGKLLNYVRRVYTLRKIKIKLKIDKSISMLDSPNIVNILSRRKDKVIISLRNHKSNEYTGIKKSIYTKLIRFLYNKADKIIAISEGVAKDLIENIKLDKNKVEVIYNPVDTKKIQRLMNEEIDEFDKFKGKKVIINSGRLTHQKGQWHLLKSFKRVCETNDNIVLAILGQGELETDLKKLASDLGVLDKVVFLGYKKNPFKYLKRADVFVLTSLFEGFGNVIVEAMATGIPVISTDCKSGPREILSEENKEYSKLKEVYYAKYGVLVPNFDANGFDDNKELTLEEKVLAEAIDSLLNDEEKINEYRTRGLERLQEFEMREITSKWENL